MSEALSKSLSLQYVERAKIQRDRDIAQMKYEYACKELIKMKMKEKESKSAQDLLKISNSQNIMIQDIRKKLDNEISEIKIFFNVNNEQLKSENSNLKEEFKLIKQEINALTQTNTQLQDNIDSLKKLVKNMREEYTEKEEVVKEKPKKEVTVEKPKREEPKGKAKAEEPKGKAKAEEPKGKAKAEEPKGKAKAEEPKGKAKPEEPNGNGQKFEREKELMYLSSNRTKNVWMSARYGRLPAVKFWLQKDPSLISEIEDEQYKWTPLHYAVANNQIHVAKYLIDKGANVNAANDLLNTPLHFATFYDGNINLVQHLIEKGANYHLRNSIGNTPLNCAILKRYNKIVRYMRSLQ